MRFGAPGPKPNAAVLAATCPTRAPDSGNARADVAAATWALARELPAPSPALGLSYLLM